jgi:signal transduction histidine kinase
MGDTSEGADGRRLAPRDHAVALLAAALIIVMTGFSVQRSRHLEVERRAAADESVLASVVAGVGVDVERGLRAVASMAADLPTHGLGALRGPTVLASVPGATDIGFVPDERDLAGSAGPPLLSTDDRAVPGVAAALDRARDSGDPQLAATIELDGALRAPLVAPVYAPGTEPGGPDTSAERRARLTGWVVAPLDLAAIVAVHTPTGSVSAIDDDGSVVGSASSESGLPDHGLAVEGRSLLVRAGSPSDVGWSAPTIGLAVGGALVALAAAALVLSVTRRLRRSETDALRRGDQVRLIGEVAPVVQQSLELAEVLPAVAVQLSDHFGLTGVSLSTGTGHAGGTELFSMGEVPEREVKAVLRPPDELAAGSTLALALQRGGRSVAVLQIVAGRDLDTSELESLRALSELVTAAMVNASLYASQQEALRRLRELDGLKTVFLGTASHELRTPATAIAGFASLLTASWDRFSEEQRRSFAERIGANARSLSAVVQDLLDFSLLDHGSLVMAIQPLELGPFVESVVDRLSPVFVNHTITCTTSAAPLVAGDPNGLERIVTNLLTNAVKFSPASSTISVTVAPAGEGAALVVCDEGPGVPADEREQVFARFFRGSGKAVVQTRGVGIGLSVVAELVDRMRGEVAVDDAPGGGARFTVRLPGVDSPADQEEHDASTA